MSSKSPRGLKRKTPRKSPSEIDAILRRFEEKWKPPNSFAEAAKLIGVPESTLYRWRRIADERPKSSGLNTARAISAASDAIDRLCYPERHADNVYEFRDAIFRFITWLRAPLEQERQLPGLIACAASYFVSSFEDKRLSELDDGLRQYFTTIIGLREIADTYARGVSNSPFFEIIEIMDQKYTEHDALAQIIWFFMASSFDDKDHRRSPSLNKAFYLIHYGCFGDKWSKSRGTFRSFWGHYSPSAVFLYVDKYHSGPDWLIDPADPNFSDYVDDIAQNRPALKTYFQRCLWVQDSFLSKLDPRARRRIQTPSFPADLTPQPITPQPLPALIEERLRVYDFTYKDLK